MLSNEYMNPDQLKIYWTMLADQQEQLEDRVAEARTLILELGSSADPVDLAVLEEARIEILRQIDHDQNNLSAIRKARERIVSKDFGWCIICDEPIGLERLLSQPIAERCIEHQHMWEKRLAQMAKGAAL
ncbi:TraR/DksA C4-type zinc finger protein [Pseudomonas sp. SIMBA_041]|uniref:TraR/DksA family transcriptional regulator n=1 Tax=Pseudomonas sp. SIMBA_041 TaxID=3085782 RepID=UPI00397A03C3